MPWYIDAFEAIAKQGPKIAKATSELAEATARRYKAWDAAAKATAAAEHANSVMEIEATEAAVRSKKALRTLKTDAFQASGRSETKTIRALNEALKASHAAIDRAKSELAEIQTLAGQVKSKITSSMEKVVRIEAKVGNAEKVVATAQHAVGPDSTLTLEAARAARTHAEASMNLTSVEAKLTLEAASVQSVALDAVSPELSRLTVAKGESIRQDIFRTLRLEDQTAGKNLTTALDKLTSARARLLPVETVEKLETEVKAAEAAKDRIVKMVTVADKFIKQNNAFEAAQKISIDAEAELTKARSELAKADATLVKALKELSDAHGELAAANIAVTQQRDAEVVLARAEIAKKAEIDRLIKAHDAKFGTNPGAPDASFTLSAGPAAGTGTASGHVDLAALDQLRPQLRDIRSRIPSGRRISGRAADNFTRELRPFKDAWRDAHGPEGEIADVEKAIADAKGYKNPARVWVETHLPSTLQINKLGGLLFDHPIMGPIKFAGAALGLLAAVGGVGLLVDVIWNAGVKGWLHQKVNAPIAAQQRQNTLQEEAQSLKDSHIQAGNTISLTGPMRFYDVNSPTAADLPTSLPSIAYIQSRYDPDVLNRQPLTLRANQSYSPVVLANGSVVQMTSGQDTYVLGMGPTGHFGLTPIGDYNAQVTQNNALPQGQNLPVAVVAPIGIKAIPARIGLAWRDLENGKFLTNVGPDLKFWKPAPPSIALMQQGKGQAPSPKAAPDYPTMGTNPTGQDQKPETRPESRKSPVSTHSTPTDTTPDSSAPGLSESQVRSLDSFGPPPPPSSSPRSDSGQFQPSSFTTTITAGATGAFVAPVPSPAVSINVGGVAQGAGSSLIGISARRPNYYGVLPKATDQSGLGASNVVSLQDGAVRDDSIFVPKPGARSLVS